MPNQQEGLLTAKRLPNETQIDPRILERLFGK